MQRFSELSVQADQTPRCARFSLQPRVALQVTETDKTAMRNLPLINKPVNHASAMITLASAAQSCLPAIAGVQRKDPGLK